MKRKKITTKKETIFFPIFIEEDKPEITPCLKTATGKHIMKKVPIVWVQKMFWNEPYEYRIECELCGFVDDRNFDKNGKRLFDDDKMHG